MACGLEDDTQCYVELGWLEEYMNLPDVRKALGVDARALDFVACDNDTNWRFMLHGDGMRDSKSLLTELVDEGVRLLVYAGNVGESHVTSIVVCSSVYTQVDSKRYDVQLHGQTLAAHIIFTETDSGLPRRASRNGSRNSRRCTRRPSARRRSSRGLCLTGKRVSYAAQARAQGTSRT